MNVQIDNPQPMFPHFWNITFPKNLFFTGQEEVLAKLKALLEKDPIPASTRPVAITGLGGIGKTSELTRLKVIVTRNAELLGLIGVLR